MIKVGVPREIHQGERRIAATPQTVLRLRKLGFEVGIEKDAGAEIGFSNGSYKEAGAKIFEDVRELWAWADVILKVRPPEQNTRLGVHEADLLREGGWLISFIWAAQNKKLLEHLASRRATVFAIDGVPRITRAQKMDALSAMANVAGYRAVIEAASHFPRFLGGQMTAAGRVEPAKVFVIGAGVAGLSAIGTARSLGAIVRAFDPRSATKDQVRSLGAEFLEINVKEEGEGVGGYAKEMSEAFIQAEMALIAQQAMEVDIIISTALIPGKPAPKLITKGMVESMKPGSVIVDLAAEQGGNCIMTEPGKIINHKGVTIIGYTDLPSRMASLSSQLYGSTLVAFLEELLDKENGQLKVNYNDQVIRGALVIHEGKITYPPPMMQPISPEPGVSAKNLNSNVQNALNTSLEHETKRNLSPIWLILAGIALSLVGVFVPPSKLSHFTVFVLACFVGWQVIWNVRPALHTPLMSVTNAISGIIIVGGMLQLSGSELNITTVLGAIAVFVATINIAGGFLVTNRMLAMFRK